jgi:hypothetical protein
MTKEEHEKEVEEWLSKNWTPYDFYDTECNVYNDDIKDDLIEVYLAGAEPREKRIAELEKENAELKEMYHESDEDNNKLRENIPILAEAKEIIKTFLAIVNNDVEYVQNLWDCKDVWKELCEKAEQFIKDSEVEK